MKAIVRTKQGPPEVLKLRDVEKPIPTENEVLIKVHASTVTTGDVFLRKLHPLLSIPLRLFGMKMKRTPGHEFAGVVEATGEETKQFKVGDQVFGTTTGSSVGANAEYVCLPEERETGVLAIKPANISYEEAAAVPVGGMTALNILGKANIQNGQKVLIHGASGSVGSFAVQIAKHLGAEVTGVCSTKNDTKEDFTKSDEIYDVIFDAVGKISSGQSKSSLQPDGHYLSVQSITKAGMEDFLRLKELIELGRVNAVIDKRYPLEQTAEAHRYVETGRKRGNVVITMA